MPLQQPELAGPDAFLEALRSSSGDLRRIFYDDPIGLAEKLGLRMPRKPVDIMEEQGLYDPQRHGKKTPGLRDLVEDVCTGRERSAAVVGPRGGGKSQGVSFIEFFLVFVRQYDALNLGGSELQADQVYQYLIEYIESDPFWKDLVKGETTQSKTATVFDAWIRVLTASTKSVRSPHAGGRKRDGRMAGGLLVIDEEAEADAEIVNAALPTINTARPSVNVRSSTFHNVEGSFADLIDSHKSMGYKLYQWDIFDICETCECRDQCESQEPCFREDHFENYVDPDTGEQEQQLIHRAYCGGRARFADGWVPMEEVETLWRRMKRNHGKWEVEAMGQRPSSKGHVIKDHLKWDSNKVATAQDLYVSGFPISICVDWGTVAAGVEVWQEQMGDIHVLLHAEQMENAGQAQIFAKILALHHTYSPYVTEVAADIGGGGNYLNPKLREEERLNVRDVNFQEEKEIAVAAMNIYNEAGKLVLPEEFEEFHSQAKRWKRNRSGRIQKGSDHMMDTAVCYFAKFVDRLNIRRVRVVPRTASSAMPSGNENPNGMRKTPRPVVRRPMMRSIGSRSKR